MTSSPNRSEGQADWVMNTTTEVSDVSEGIPARVLELLRGQIRPQVRVLLQEPDPLHRRHAPVQIQRRKVPPPSRLTRTGRRKERHPYQR
jgi:hypothetical protein